jgi:nicotinamide-nucleotide amidase
MEKVYATIITIGDELLIGQVVDTNSAWIAQQLNAIGILVKQRISVGDDAREIMDALDKAAAISQAVLITGGLGPTADDITKPTLCAYFGGNLKVDEEALQNVKIIFQKLQRPLIERNLKQAEVPDNCTVIQNARGTAPGMWFEKMGVYFVSMPGVPFEMQGMMTDFVLPALKRSLTLPAVVHRTLLTAGIGESFLAELIQDWEKALPSFIKLAYLPNYGMVRLRLTATGYDKIKIEEATDKAFADLQGLVQDYLVSNVDETIEKKVASLLLRTGKTMSTAESCTGGYMAHLLTRHPGSSAYYLGSVISYDNSVKHDVLQVPEDLLKRGAVSEPVVVQMVRGVLEATGSDYAVAVSGIMGPDGGTGEKPVGTVWMAAGSREDIVTQQMHFRFDRMRNIELTSAHAFNLLRKFLLQENQA